MQKHNISDSSTQPTEDIKNLRTYPIAMSSYLDLPHCTFDSVGVPFYSGSTEYYSTVIVQYALAHWNNYLLTGDSHDRNTFLLQAQWLVANEVYIVDKVGVWPIALPHPDVPAQSLWLSATTQGCAISVLVRAYQLTKQEIFFNSAKRAIYAFDRDILDGGISTPLGEKGVFFEDVAVYPASHSLSGFLFAILGLQEYLLIAEDKHIEVLIEQSLATLHSYIDEFDLGYWTCTNLLHRRLSFPHQLSLQAELLEAVAEYSKCNHCSALALHWKDYQSRSTNRLRYSIMNRSLAYGRALLTRVRSFLFTKVHPSERLNICVSLPTFPTTGGIFTVLEGIDYVTKDIWQQEYLTQFVGSQHPEKYTIHQFGTVKMTPWLFPNIWLYFIAGMYKLTSLLRNGASYQVIFPQDAIFTGAFCALVAKFVGIRVVCIDHGDLTLLHSQFYRTERLKDLTRKPWPFMFRTFMQQLLFFYWPSRYVQARIAAHFVDSFLVPGIAGDGVEEVCEELGIPKSRITRFASMINTDQHILLSTLQKAHMREKKGISADAIVIAIICRLAPEKGLDIAIAGISQALANLQPDICNRVRIIIAGDGPLRSLAEEYVHTHKVAQNCTLWGDISPQEVLSLLAMSNIFLYTSVRGACFPMAVLEAMASGCAVIASTRPMSNAHLLAEGRGIAISPGDIAQTREALTQLINNPEQSQCMGNLAREYILAQHNPTLFRRTLIRATFWAGLKEILERKLEADLEDSVL